MVIICQQCAAHLQLDDAKVPARAFTVRCPKCQHSINATPPAVPSEPFPYAPAADNASPTAPARFQRPMPAPIFRHDAADGDDSKLSSTSAAGAPASDKDALALLLSGLLERVLANETGGGGTSPSRAALSGGRDRDYRRALVCAEEAHRFAVARVLMENDYEVYVAEDTTQAIERMREDRMDVVVLSPNFDAVEQGAAFVKREISALRPALRRCVFIVLLAPDVRTGDPHDAFVRHANFCINPDDIEDLPRALARAVRDFHELYRDFNHALQASAF